MHGVYSTTSDLCNNRCLVFYHTCTSDISYIVLATAAVCLHVGSAQTDLFILLGYAECGSHVHDRMCANYIAS